MALTTAQQAGITRSEIETYVDCSEHDYRSIIVGSCEVITAKGPTKKTFFAGAACLLPEDWAVVRPDARVWAKGWECAALIEVPLFDKEAKKQARLAGRRINRKAFR